MSHFLPASRTFVSQKAQSKPSSPAVCSAAEDGDDGDVFCCSPSFPLLFFCSLSQFSEENMMDPYNLAICFGPTLMSVPEGHDQVSCQAHVNELIKTIIIQHENIFPGPRELEGPVYSRGGNTEDYWYDGCSEESSGGMFIHGLGCCSRVLCVG